MAQNLRKYRIPICAKKKVFSIFNTKKVRAEKQKLRPFLVIFLENSPASNCVRTGMGNIRLAGRIRSARLFRAPRRQLQKNEQNI